jgi:hypothetical protein
MKCRRFLIPVVVFAVAACSEGHGVKGSTNSDLSATQAVATIGDDARPGPQFGRSLIAKYIDFSRDGACLLEVPDVDADGRPDVLVGLPFTPRDGEPNVGRVVMVGSASGRVIREWFGAERGDTFGFSLCLAGTPKDPMYLVGAPCVDPDSAKWGYISRLTPLSAQPLPAIPSPEELGLFGLTMCVCADQNGDSQPDVCVAAPRWARSAAGAERYQSIAVFALPGGVWIRSVRLADGERMDDPLIDRLVATQDLNGDEVPDLCACSPTANRITILSGKDLTTFGEVTGPGWSDFGGACIPYDPNGIHSGLLVSATMFNTVYIVQKGHNGKFASRQIVPCDRDNQLAISLAVGDRAQGSDWPEVIIGAPGPALLQGFFGIEVVRATSGSGRGASKCGHLLVASVSEYGPGRSVESKAACDAFGKALLSIEDIDGDSRRDLIVAWGASMSQHIGLLRSTTNTFAWTLNL